MATINLSWTPGSGANVTGQLVQRRTGGGAWTTIATLNSTASTYSDTTASDNTVYDYQIITNCEVGGPVDSSDASAIKFVCPTIVATVTDNDVEIALPALTGDIEYSSIEVFEAGTSVFSQGVSGQSAQNINVNNLNYSTTYSYIVTLTAGGFTHECTRDFTIEAEPTCPPASGLTATVQDDVPQE